MTKKSAIIYSLCLEIEKISTAYKKINFPLVLLVKKILTFLLFKIEKKRTKRRRVLVLLILLILKFSHIDQENVELQVNEGSELIFITDKP